MLAKNINEVMYIAFQPRQIDKTNYPPLGIFFINKLNSMKRDKKFMPSLKTEVTTKVPIFCGISLEHLNGFSSDLETRTTSSSRWPG